MSSSPDWARRKTANDISKSWAQRDGEPWSSDEDDLLLTDWIGVAASDRDEVTISQILERTIEACRVRCEHIRRRLGIQVFEVTSTTTTVTKYIGVMDDPEDQWWSPEYYNKGR